jgi:hypothetical protein
MQSLARQRNISLTTNMSYKSKWMRSRQNNGATNISTLNNPILKTKSNVHVMKDQILLASWRSLCWGVIWILVSYLSKTHSDCCIRAFYRDTSIRITNENKIARKVYKKGVMVFPVRLELWSFIDDLNSWGLKFRGRIINKSTNNLAELVWLYQAIGIF